MKIIEFGLRAFLNHNGWEKIEENNYEKGNRNIEISHNREIKLYQQGEYLLTCNFDMVDIGLVKYFIIS